MYSWIENELVMCLHVVALGKPPILIIKLEEDGSKLNTNLWVSS